MLKSIKCFASLSIVLMLCGVVSADIILPTPELIGTAKFGEPLVVKNNGTEFVVVYNNSTQPQALGTYSAPGATSGATRVVADDTVPTAGGILNEFSFSMTNANTVAVSARPRVRFWAADGAAGGPGTLIGGFTFNPITVNPNTLNVFTTGQTLGASNIVLPNAPIWFGLLFDNLGGSTATDPQLDLLGQIIMDPPTVGTSNAMVMWQSTATGSNFVNNPVGATLSHPTGLPSNILWEYQVVPEPTAMLLVFAGALALAFRRRG